jgi:hypothetical protein
MPIPQIDPMPVPAPLWLLRTLLLLTFTLHLLFMNALLGGALAALVASRGRSKFAAQLVSDLKRILPSTFAFTITLGVAPLLFLQVLYGHLLYASAVLMAVPWLSIIGLVVLAYYGIYYFVFHAEKRPRGALAVLGVATVLLAAIGFIYSNNFTLMLRPERWLSLYAHSAAGWNANWTEPTLVPRYLHMLLGAFAITGLLLVLLGIRKGDTDYGRWLVEQGGLLFLGPTILNIFVGFWFLIRLPQPVMMTLMGNALAAVALGLSVLLPLAAVAHMIMAKAGRSPRRNAALSIGAGVLTVGAMVIVRDAVRNAYLMPQFRLQQLQVAPQWGVIVLFVVLFVLGLLTLGYMLRAVARRPEPVGAAAASKW